MKISALLFIVCVCVSYICYGIGYNNGVKRVAEIEDSVRQYKHITDSLMFEYCRSINDELLDSIHHEDEDN